MQLRKITQKKAALELSVGTVVVIVLAMTMLILGVVLVRNIFGVATQSVNIIDDNLRTEITSIFAEEDTKIGIKLGEDKLAKIKQGSDLVGIGFGGQTRNGEPVNPAIGPPNLKYALELSNDACGATFESYVLDHNFNGPVLDSHPATGKLSFDDIEGANGYTVLFFNIPKGTAECTQKIKIHIYDHRNAEIAASTFRVQVISGGIFS